MMKSIICKLQSKVLEKVSMIREDNRGIGTVEVILILVVLIGLVVIFRNQLTTLINDIFGRIATDAAGI